MRKIMTMTITHREEIKGCGWAKRTSTTSEISNDYIRNTMGIVGDDKPLDVIVGEFRQYLAGIDEKDDEFGLGLIDSMTDFVVDTTYGEGRVVYKASGIEFKWMIYNE